MTHKWEETAQPKNLPAIFPPVAHDNSQNGATPEIDLLPQQVALSQPHRAQAHMADPPSILLGPPLRSPAAQRSPSNVWLKMPSR